MNKVQYNPVTDIAFSRNWNRKLNALYFTTIRIPQAKFSPGRIFRILCDGQYCYDAKICEVQLKLLDQLDEITCRQDTGLSRAETLGLIRKIYPEYDFLTQPVALILLGRTE